MISCGFFIDYFVVYFLLCLLIQQSFDDINGFLDTIIRTVDTKVIIFRFSPFLSSVKFVIFFVLFIHLLQKRTACFISILRTSITCCVRTWNGALINILICGIWLFLRIASAHRPMIEAVLCSCQFTDQIAHIKEDRILLGKSMITIQFFQFRLEALMRFLSILIEIRKILFI